MEDLQERRIGYLTIRIDRDRCIGTSNCIKVAPEVFYLDEEGVCAFCEPPECEDAGRLVDACSVCPVDALIVIDEDGTQIIPPSVE